ncbi:hypothetical protein [Mucilaginibacter gossypii]|uniref:Uncharacterized protein n=1 Tax=Mucilaginibacter gossypii TaxID=551996 RepID=A0A1G8A3Z0_9SPHI|nr:hypothetical protein [Mucilaginibacter gossypii]SDH15659.1 hypothetical protein SAMN05192573_10786 [Mucilaginibacter gossypii]
MKTEKLKLTAPKTAKLYGYSKPSAVKMFETSTGTDPTTTCTTSISTTHIYNA